MRGFAVLMTLLCSLGCTRASGGTDAAVAADAAVAVQLPAIDLDARYRDKPMLAVIEGYALAAIGQLPTAQEALIASKVTSAFGGGNDWRATVRKTMRWPDNLDERIQFDWRVFSEKTTKTGTAPDSRAFARAFADRYSQ